MVHKSDSERSEQRIRRDLEALCSDACAGRAAGSGGGRAARQLLLAALRGAGLTPQEQALPRGHGANVVAHVAGTTPRWVLVAAHYDHLGTRGAQTYRGADDNAAAVAFLLELARSLARQPPLGRGVVLAAFDSEEPPAFLMGSRAYVAQPSVPLSALDLMICMDLVGHELGTRDAPSAVRETLFVLGAEHSAGISALVDSLSTRVPGVIARRANANIIPILSDYGPFWERDIPFAFLTCGRWRHYHTPEDTPDRLDDAVLTARARWLELLTRSACALTAEPAFVREAADDAATLRSLLALAVALESVAGPAARFRRAADALLAECDAAGRLPERRRDDLRALVGALESALS